MFTEQGLVKKVVLSEFSNPRRQRYCSSRTLKRAITDRCKLTDATQDICDWNANGLAIRFHEDEIRPMGRSAAGVRGIRLSKGG